ncbi:MAG: DUF3575 domain-containing protein [Prevotellaceae bacterium]|jgi:hypothetical protein|nr:DUF3575 domain-containing protein [Prevotellaceae bacterium]
MDTKRIIPVALLCMAGVFGTTAQAAGKTANNSGLRTTVANSTLVNNMRDSIYMDVLRHGRVAVSYLCYFQPSSSTNNSIGYDAAQLRRLDAFFESNLKDSQLRFDHATLVGSASIDGLLSVNEELSLQRAQFLRDFLNRRYQLSDYLPVEVSSIGEDWDGLETYVQQLPLSTLPYRDEVLRIIRQVPIVAGREKQLMLLNNGKTYQYLKQHFFPYQRRSFITIVYDMNISFNLKLNNNLEMQSLNKPEERMVDSLVARALLTPREAATFLSDTTIQSMPVALPNFENSPDRIRAILQEKLGKIRRQVEEVKATQPVDTPPAPVALKTDTVFISVAPDTVYVTRSQSNRNAYRPHVAVKSNLLALAGVSPEPAYRTPMPNLEVEYLFNRHWSAAFTALYEKFSHSRGYNVWHVTAYTLEGRYRLVPDHHYGGLYLGVYARVGDYNFRKPYPTNEESGPLYNNTGYYQEGGLSLGYTLPLSRHWILEAGAAGGYRHTGAKHYTHENPTENLYDYRTPDGGIHLTDIFLRIGYRF